MSTTIDTNIVQMKFDNKQFEEGCKESMSTLEKLKQKINESNSGNSLNGLNKVDLSGLEKSVDKIANRFTLLGNVAFKIKDKIADAFLGMAKTLATTVPNIISQGGWDRAMNIERAKFQLEGLKVAWEDIADDISYAVDGTAYGLDAAASAASQLVASGVQVGDSMKNALRAISGVAAMTNTQYEEISPIFTTVAGQGKVMTMQLRQLENRGLNAAATMAEYFKGVMNGSIEASDSVKEHVAEITQQFGYGEASVREMVTKGVIDFNTFSNAMDNAFGEHAKDANRTFEGVTANIRAALKKIGADFATPIIEQDGPVVQALQQLRERINDVRASLGPLTKVWTDFVHTYANNARLLFKHMDMSFMKDVAQGLTNIFKALLSVLDPIRYAFADIFLNTRGVKGISDLAKAFSDLTAKLILSDKEMEDLRATVRGVLSVFSIIGTVIKQILGALLSVKPETISIREIILSITGTVGDLITYVSRLIKQTNVVEPIIKGIANVLKMVFSLLAVGIINIARFINYISKLPITKDIINGVTIAVKGLVVGIVLLIGTIAKLISGGISKLPRVLLNLKANFIDFIDMLKQFSIVDTVVNGFKKLADSIDKLLHPVKDTKDLEGVITIADEAVALAGPKKVTMLDKFASAIVKVKDKIVEIGGAIVGFVKNLDYGAIAAVAFTVAIAGIGYKLSKTFQSVADTFAATQKAVTEVGGLIGSLKNRSIMELIFGKKEPPQQHKLLEFAAAILAVGISVKVLSTIKINKLKEVGKFLAEFAVGVGALAIVFTVLQKILGKGEILALSSSLYAIAGSLALMVAALAAATYIDYTNIQAAGLAIAQLTLVLGGMAIALAKLSPVLSKGSLSLIAMALSLKILVGALDKLSQLEIEVSLLTKEGRNLWGKTGLLMAMATGLVLISGIASKLGTNSLLGIVVALLSLKVIIPLASSIATQAQIAWAKIVLYFETIKSEHPKVMAGIVTILKIIGAIAAVIAVVYVIKKAFVAIKEIGNTVSGMQQTTEKFAGLQKALSRLALVPVILALTGMFIAIGAMVVVLGKIKLPYLKQAIWIMVAIGGIFLALANVVKSSKDSKPGAIIGAMVGITMLFSELIVLTLLVEKHWAGMIVACGIMATIMHELSEVFDSIAKASELSGKTLVAIGMIAVIVAELGGIIFLLSQQDWTGVLSSGAAMFLALKGIADMLSALGEKGQSFGKEKMKILAETIALLPIVGASIAIATLTHDWASIGAAGVAMWLVLNGMGDMLSALGEKGQSFGKEKITALLACAVALVPVGAALALATLNKDWKSIGAAGAAMFAAMLGFAAMLAIIGRVKVDMNLEKFALIAACAGVTVAIGAALALATLSHDWMLIGVAAIAMSGVMLVFSGMFALLGKMDVKSAGTAFIALLGISIAAVSIGASLAMLAQYDWQKIAAAAGIMAATLAVLGLIAGVLGLFPEFVIPGALALDLLAVAMLGISTAISMFLNALTLFLPVANAFISDVLGTLVSFGPQLPEVGAGLVQLAVGLAAVGAAGIVLGLGAIGLVAASLSLPILAIGLQMISSIDFETMASGLNSLANANLVGLAVGLVAIGAAGVVLALGGTGLIVGAAGLTALAPACQALQGVDLIPLAEGLAALVIPGLAMALVGPAMIIASVGFIAFAAALSGLLTVISPALDSLDKIKDKSDEAKTWGSDLVQNFISGIKDKIGNLISTMKEMAQTVKDYIGFSQPEKGPLSDFDTYAPDMMDNFCGNLKDSFPELENTMSEMGLTIEGSFDDIDLSSVGKQLGIDLGSGELEGVMSYINQIRKEISSATKPINKAGKYTPYANGIPTDVQRQQQEYNIRLKEEADAADKATDSLNDLTTATGKTGGASSKAADNVKDLSDAFKTVERGTKVNLGNMINSLAENYQETARWAQDMKTLMGKGFDKSITDWIKKMGVGGHETVKAFINASEEEVNVLNTAMKSYLTIDDDAEKYILGKYDEFGAKIAEVLSDSVQTYSTKLAETIQDAIDPFKEFDKKTELTGDKMLANMRSQISGVTEWSDNVISLMGRVPEELIQYFQDLGPASYEEVNAMAHMTEGQLTEAVELWNTQIELGKMLAIQQAQKYREVGQAVTDGLEDGIDFDKPYQDGAEIGDNIIDGTKDKLDSHSPSRVFLQIGKDTVQGLVNGIKVTGHIPVNEMIIVCTNVMNEASRVLSFQAGQTIGSNLTAGIAQGIRDGESGVINQAVATAVAAYEAAKRALDINSPSKLFRKLGLSMDEGWAQGIDAGTGMVTSATQRMADNTVQMMNDIIKNISETVNDSPEFQPVIRPELDLTALQNGKSKINEMLKTSPAASLRDRMFAKMDSPIEVNNPNVGSTTVINNYNQTNNSPKSLDTYEIYRQSRNLFNMVKGANI